MFDLALADRVAHMVRDLALPQVWNKLQRYFEPDHGDDMDDQHQLRDHDDVHNDDEPISRDDTERDMDASIDDVHSRLDRKENEDDDTGTRKGENDHKSAARTSALNASLAWLMSFPQSGESLVLEDVEKLSGMTTASLDWGPEILAPSCAGSMTTYSGGDDSFVLCLRNPQLQVPSTMVLAEMHCGGTCHDCSPVDYFFPNSSSFEVSCRMAPMFNQSVDQEEEPVFDESVDQGQKPQLLIPTPAKAILVIRNPLEVIISRIQHGLRYSPESMPWPAEESKRLRFSKESLERWCSHVDRQFKQGLHLMELLPAELADHLEPLLPLVPCHDDWYRFVQWYNWAFEMLESFDIPIAIVHIEEYISSLPESTRQILEFLELPEAQVEENLPFSAAHGADSTTHRLHKHQDWISADEGLAASRLVQAVASPECWNHLQRYFAPWLQKNSNG